MKIMSYTSYSDGIDNEVYKMSFDVKLNHFPHQNYVIRSGKKENVHQDKNIQKDDNRDIM